MHLLRNHVRSVRENTIIKKFADNGNYKKRKRTIKWRPSTKNQLFKDTIMDGDANVVIDEGYESPTPFSWD